MARTQDRYRSAPSAGDLRELPVFDAAFPKTERFPRRLIVEFTESQEQSNRVVAQMRLTAAEPNAFMAGPLERDGRAAGFQVGAVLGDPLSDNSRQADDYRYHDAIHFGFLAVLGWSPNLRSLLRLKRKSHPQTDECEDGARAIFAEEGLAAILARLAKNRIGFLNETSVDGDVIEVARAAVAGLEVEGVPAWLWGRAISQGFAVLYQLAEHKGGYVIADLDEHRLSYEKVLR